MKIHSDTTPHRGRSGHGTEFLIGLVAGPVATELLGRALHSLVAQPARGWIQFGAAAAAAALVAARRATRWLGVGAASGIVAVFGTGYLLAWWFAESINPLNR